MALALFIDTPDVQRDADGRWTLVRERPAVARISDGLTSRSLDALSYVVVDVETTGGSPVGGDRITEFCAVTVANGRIAGVFETLINPQRPIPPAVTRLTRITWDMVRNAPTIRDVAPRIADVLRGHVFVAHNAAFDWRFVTSELSTLCGPAGRRRKALHGEARARRRARHPTSVTRFTRRTSTASRTMRGTGPVATHWPPRKSCFACWTRRAIAAAKPWRTCG